MPASLLSCLWAFGCPACACWGRWGGEGAVFQNALTAEQSPPAPVSGPCVSHPARRTGWLASRTEPAQSHRCTLPAEAARPAWLLPSAVSRGPRQLVAVGGGGPGDREAGLGVPGVGSP